MFIWNQLTRSTYIRDNGRASASSRLKQSRREALRPRRKTESIGLLQEGRDVIFAQATHPAQVGAFCRLNLIGQRAITRQGKHHAAIGELASSRGINNGGNTLLGDKSPDKRHEKVVLIELKFCTKISLGGALAELGGIN